MKLLYVVLALWLLSSPVLAQDENAEKQAIEEVVLNYIENFFANQFEAMNKSLHPRLAKRGLNENAKTISEDFPPEKLKELMSTKPKLAPELQSNIVENISVFENMASAVLSTGYPKLRWVEYLHLVKLEGEWKIINVFWDFERKPPVALHSKSGQIDQIMKLYHEYGLFSGTVLVSEKGIPIYQSAFGLSNIELGVPHTTEMKFLVGSITKQFTAVLILQMVEEGKLNLSDPISKHLASYPNARGNDITIHHLLSHTSGLQHWGGIEDFLLSKARLRYEKDAIVAMYAELPERNKPGQGFAYSSIGYYLLGMILEEVSGRTYGELVKEKIFDPLGMNNSTFSDSDEIVENKATPYRYNFVTARYDSAEYRDSSTTFSTGGIISTVEDLLKWDQALYTDRILSYQSIKTLLEPNFDRYSYGFHVNLRGRHSDLNTRWHGGLVTGYRSQITRLIDENKTVILLTNRRDTDTHAITNKILDVLRGTTPELPKRSLFKFVLEETANESVESAISKLNDLVKNGSTDYELSEVEVFRAGLELKSDGAYRSSTKLMQGVIDLFPSTPYRTQLEYHIADSYSELNNAARAIEFARKVLVADPNHEGAKRIIARWQQK